MVLIGDVTPHYMPQEAREQRVALVAEVVSVHDTVSVRADFL